MLGDVGDGAFAGLAQAGVGDPLPGVGDEGVGPVLVEGGSRPARRPPRRRASGRRSGSCPTRGASWIAAPPP